MFAGYRKGFGGTRRMSEISGAIDGGSGGARTGLALGTLLATEHGYRGVERLHPGDLVMTFDHGLRRIRAVERRLLWSGAPARCPRHLWPLRVPAGLLGNQAEMLVLPGQAVMVESDAAEATLGDPFVLMPAAALAEVPGVEAVPPAGAVEVFHLQFDRDEVVFSDASVQYLCPARHDILAQAEARAPGFAGYRPLGMDTALALVRAELGVGMDGAERRVA